MRRPQSAQIQKLSSKPKEEIRQYKVYSPKGPDDIKYSAKTTQVKQQYNEQFDDNLTTHDANHTRKKSEHNFYLTSYQHRMKLLQNEVAVLKQQLKLSCRSRGQSPQQDYQQQFQLYEEEIYRLQGMLHEVLQRPADQKKNQLVSFLATIQEQKGIIQKQSQQIENYQREIQNMRNNQENQINQNQLKQSNIQQNHSEESERLSTLKQQFNQQLQEKEKQLQKNKAKLMSQVQFIEQLTTQIDSKQKILNMYEEELDQQKQENYYLSEQLKEVQMQLELANQQQAQTSIQQETQIKTKNLQLNISQQIFQYFKEQTVKQNKPKNISLTCQSSQVSQQVQIQKQKIKNLSCQSQTINIYIQSIQNNQKNKPLKQLAISSQIVTQSILRSQAQTQFIVDKLVTDYLNSFLQIQTYKKVDNEKEDYYEQIVSNYLKDTLEKNIQENILITNQVEKYLQKFIN